MIQSELLDFCLFGLKKGQTDVNRIFLQDRELGVKTDLFMFDYDALIN